MPASVVIVRNLLETETQIQGRTNPLNRVNGVAFQGCVKLARWDVGRINAYFCKHLTGEARNTHLQALQVFESVDFLAKPAAHLNAGVATRERQHIVRLVNLLHQFHTTAVVEPGVLFHRVHAERHACEEQGVGYFAFPVVGRGMTHVVLAGLDHIKDTEGRFVLV